MRIRFSLRTLMIVTGLLAGFCYYWIVMPSATAKRFIRSISSEDYKTADRLFWKADDRVLAEWNEQRWGFQSTAELAPWSLYQLLSGHRELRLHVAYFQFDQNHDIEFQVTATSFGLNAPKNGVTKTAMIIDSREGRRADERIVPKR